MTPESEPTPIRPPSPSPPLINRNSTGALGTPKLHRLLLSECALAEATMRTIVNQSIADHLQQPSLDESPLKPWIIQMAKTILIYRTSTSACGVTALSGDGVLIKRLPSPHPTLIKWSAPLFIKIRSRGGGILFGTQKRNAFAVCTTRQLEELLLGKISSTSDSKKVARPVRGIEFAMSCGSGVSEKTDIISVPFGQELDLVSVSHTSGPIFGAAFLAGVMVGAEHDDLRPALDRPDALTRAAFARWLALQEVDAEKNAETYGAGVAARDILNTRDPPAEFQPIYGEMNRIVNRVERCSSVSRTSASLERFSTGRDPDQVMVQSDGSVLA